MEIDNRTDIAVNLKNISERKGAENRVRASFYFYEGDDCVTHLDPYPF